MKILQIALIVGVSLFLISAAYAESGCPPGMIPYRAGTDPNACGPIPTVSGPTMPTGPQWASRWGAIASDASKGVMGAVDSRSSKREASRLAITECKTRGGLDCKVRFTYHNQCVVTVQGSSGATNSGAATIEEATNIGMRSCAEHGDTDCDIYYKACSLPVRVR
jgi:hypothetical protein